MWSGNGVSFTPSLASRLNSSLNTAGPSPPPNPICNRFEMLTIWTLWHLLRPPRWWFAAALVIGALSSLTEGIGITLFIPILTRLQAGIDGTELPSILQRILPSIARTQIDTLVLVVLALVCLKNLLLYGNRALLAWMDGATGHDLRSRIFDGLMSAPLSFWDRRDPGKVLDTLANESWRTAQAFQHLSGSLVQACTVAVLTVLLLLISWKLTVVAALGLAVISAGIRLGTRPVKLLGEHAVRTNAELGARMWDGVAGIRSIHALSLEADKWRRFMAVSGQVRKAFLRLELVAGVAHPASEVLHATLLIGVLVWLLPHSASAPTTLVFLLLLFRLQQNVSQLQSSWINLEGLGGSIEEVRELVDSTRYQRSQSGVMPFRTLADALSFEAVTFRYDGETRAALNDVSFRIPARKVTAIVGPSGAGKTTIVHLICRFYDVSAGTIRADRHPLPGLEINSWRQRIGLASQDTHLFSTSVRENISLGNHRATDDQIVRAAMLADAHDFISQLPDGYETLVGERGLRLSGGQRQRIALARAFVRQPDILLLDEATNALDTTTEDAISRTLRDMEGQCTIVVVAHRTSTISTADHVIVVDEGRVVQQGAPADLMESDGPFFELFRVHRSVLKSTTNLCGTA
jgi:subfamily B ATP-binding cassette protein MsbA